MRDKTEIRREIEEIWEGRARYRGKLERKEGEDRETEGYVWEIEGDEIRERREMVRDTKRYREMRNTRLVREEREL